MTPRSVPSAISMLMFAVFLACSQDEPLGESEAGLESSGHWVEMTPQGGLRNPRVVPWGRIEAQSDGRLASIFFTAGSNGCGMLSEVRVTSGTKEVVVTLVLGDQPRYEGKGPGQERIALACTDVGVAAVTNVALPEPLRGRKVTDGAKAPGSPS